jgi:hypothetical protein
MSAKKQAQASNDDTFKTVGHLIRILNEATELSLRMEATQVAIKEHLLPDLEIATHTYFMSSKFKERTFAKSAAHIFKKTVGISVKPNILFSADAALIAEPAKPTNPSTNLQQKLSNMGIAFVDAEFHWAPAENFRIPESCAFHEMDDESFLFHDKGTNRIMRAPRKRIEAAGRVQTLRGAFHAMGNGGSSSAGTSILYGKHDTFSVPPKNNLRKEKTQDLSPRSPKNKPSIG